MWCLSSGSYFLFNCKRKNKGRLSRIKTSSTNTTCWRISHWTTVVKIETSTSACWEYAGWFFIILTARKLQVSGTQHLATWPKVPWPRTSLTIYLQDSIPVRTANDNFITIKVDTNDLSCLIKLKYAWFRSHELYSGKGLFTHITSSNCTDDGCTTLRN